MRVRSVVFVASCVVLSACTETRPTQVTQVITPPPAVARPVVPAAPVGTPGVERRIAAAGVPLRTDFFADINADCSSAGVAKITLATNPSHGAVSIQLVSDYTNFPANNQRYACNKQKSPGVAVQYTGAQGYAGIDTFSLSIVLPSGTPLQRTVIINVQPKS